MTDGTGSTAPEAQYIAVQNLPYELVPGCAKTFRKHLLTTERLEVQQTLIQGGGNPENCGVCATDRTAYVLAGSVVLKNQDRTQVGKGQLIVIPAGAHWGEQLSLLSEELVLLEVAGTGADHSICNWQSPNDCFVRMSPLPITISPFSIFQFSAPSQADR